MAVSSTCASSYYMNMTGNPNLDHSKGKFKYITISTQVHPVDNGLLRQSHWVAIPFFIVPEQLGISMPNDKRYITPGYPATTDYSLSQPQRSRLSPRLLCCPHCNI